MRKSIFIIATTIMLAGCAKKDLTPQPVASVEETSQQEADATNSSEHIEPEVQEVDGAIVIPTEFITYEDGQEHKVAYYADETGISYNIFRNLSIPEHGIASVSFPIRYIESSEEDLHVVENGRLLVTKEEDLDKIYDLSTFPDAVPEGTYARFTIGGGECGIIDSEATIEGDVPTIEEMKALALEYNLHVVEPIFEDTSKDGSRVFSCYAATTAFSSPDEEPYNWYGVMSVRFKNGRAQGTFYAYSGDLSYTQQFASYTIQSLRFAD